MSKAKDLNTLIKESLNKDNVNVNISAKVPSLCYKVDNKEMEKFQNALSEYTMNLDKPSKIIKNSNTGKPSQAIDTEKVRYLLNYIGIFLISPEIINLFYTMMQLTQKIKEYEQIKNNPHELSTLLQRIPDGSYFKINNKEVNLVHNEDAINAKAVLPTLSVLDIFKDIDPDSIVDFYRYMCNTPLLGLKHKVGRKIYDSIINEDIHNYKTKVKATLYRGRIRRNGQPYSEKQMFEAPFGYPGIGRANTTGMPALYFTDSIDATIEETNWNNTKDTLDIMEVKVNRNFTLLDISDRSCPLIRYCYFPHDTENDFTSYIIPNYLADCCRAKGVDGMIYKSVKDKSATNYVFFNSSKQWFKNIKIHSRGVANI